MYEVNENVKEKLLKGHPAASQPSFMFYSFIVLLNLIPLDSADLIHP